MIALNEYPASSVVPIFFSTYGKTNGESITLTGLAVTDIEIYKGTSVTQRSSDAGYTLLDTDGIDFDGITGIHGFSIDLGDNTDAGFYAVGSIYTVVVSAVTVDSQTVNFIADRFRIAPAEGITGYPKVDVHAVNAGATAAANLKTAGDNYSATRGLAGTALPAAAADAAGGLPISDAGGLDLDAKLAATNEVTAARMGALTDWINGGRLDLLLDAIKAVTDLLPNGGALTSLATAASIAALNNLSAAQVNAEADTALSDAGVTSARQAKLDEVTAARMGALTDWIDGGRLDLIIDAINAAVAAAAIRTALGLASANLDTQLDALPTAAENAAALLDLSNGIETSITPRQAIRLILASAAGKLSGAATTTVTIRNVGDSKDRITATVDSSGNRTAVTTDGT